MGSSREAPPCLESRLVIAIRPLKIKENVDVDPHVVIAIGAAFADFKGPKKQDNDA